MITLKRISGKAAAAAGILIAAGTASAQVPPPPPAPPATPVPWGSPLIYILALLGFGWFTLLRHRRKQK